MGKRDRERIQRIERGEEAVFRQSPTEVIDIAPSEERIAEGVGKLKMSQRSKAVDKMLNHIKKNYDPKRGARFKNTDDEVSNFLNDVGSSLAGLFTPYRHEIVEICRNWRQKYGLPL